MNDGNNREHFTRVKNDPRRKERGPSKQWLTDWPFNQVASKASIERIDELNPNGVVIHGVGPELASAGWIVRKLRQYFDKKYKEKFGTELEIACAIAGDWDKKDIPGFSDGWDSAAKMAEENGLAFIQTNCEVAQLHRPEGSALTGLQKIRNNAPNTEIRHTGYGATDNIDQDPDKPGWQGFGGHHGGQLNEYTILLDEHGKPYVKKNAPQTYWGRKGGEFQPRGYGMQKQNAYCISIASTIGTGKNDEVNPQIEIYPYVQGWGCRVDEICHFVEYFDEAQHWVSTYLRDAGKISLACMSELFRRKLSIRDFQRQQGLDPHGWLDEATYEALFPTKPWRYPPDYSVLAKKMGLTTPEKIKEFQRLNGFPEDECDGIIGKNTFAKMEAVFYAK